MAAWQRRLHHPSLTADAASGQQISHQRNQLPAAAVTAVAAQGFTSPTHQALHTLRAAAAAASANRKQVRFVRLQSFCRHMRRHTCSEAS
jgi:hypothetical protein